VRGAACTTAHADPVVSAHAQESWAGFERVMLAQPASGAVASICPARRQASLLIESAQVRSFPNPGNVGEADGQVRSVGEVGGVTDDGHDVVEPVLLCDDVLDRDGARLSGGFS